MKTTYDPTQKLRNLDEALRDVISDPRFDSLFRTKLRNEAWERVDQARTALASNTQETSLYPYPMQGWNQPRT
jgi:hypothetical protein